MTWMVVSLSEASIFRTEVSHQGRPPYLLYPLSAYPCKLDSITMKVVKRPNKKMFHCLLFVWLGFFFFFFFFFPIIQVKKQLFGTISPIFENI